jgi:hypothetical protein
VLRGAQLSLDLRSLMDPALVGDLALMKLSTKISDQLCRCGLMRFSAFCEATGMNLWLLFLGSRDRDEFVPTFCGPHEDSNCMNLWPHRSERVVYASCGGYFCHVGWLIWIKGDKRVFESPL